MTKKRGRPPTDPKERAKWEEHQKAVEKARLAAEAGLQRRQNQPTAAGQQVIERRSKQQQQDHAAAAATAATAAANKTQMTFLQPKFHPAPLGVRSAC